MLEKLCRICPNTASWERPTGNKEESGGFAGANGFGIEEWLTRKEWLLSGYNGLLESWRYAHITALWTKNNAYVGQDMRIYLFTYDKGAWLVGYINQAHLIDEDEAAWATEQFRRNGWLDAMRQDVKASEEMWTSCRIRPCRLALWGMSACVSSRIVCISCRSPSDLL